MGMTVLAGFFNSQGQDFASRFAQLFVVIPKIKFSHNPLLTRGGKQ
jgi:hypothetical protein